ncbi:MAG: DUF4091 domain-containing protein, partial [Kiritimatiellae bacterium]|nr:DUF4091 domain-containing protein [Kiritimatiellia bacterium]
HGTARGARRKAVRNPKVQQAVCRHRRDILLRLHRTRQDAPARNDERGKEYYAGLHKLCARLKADFPSLPLLTTALLYNDIESRWSKFLTGGAKLDDLIVTDIYCPLTTRWHNDISDYLRTQGRLVYWYTAGSPIWPYANFAGYDHPPVEGRLVLGFQTHFFRADGFLFWHVNYWNGKEQEPFDDADTFVPGWLYTGGDGILLYPGKDRVFPSIRLATVRDGVQDYEWLQLAERKCGRAAVDAVSRTLIRSLTDFTRDPAELERAHAAVGDMIEGNHLSAPSSRQSNRDVSVVQK